jgi:hypothetical protein
MGTSRGTFLFGGSLQHDHYTYDDTWIYDSRSDQWKEVSSGSKIGGEEKPNSAGPPRPVIIDTVITCYKIRGIVLSEF